MIEKNCLFSQLAILININSQQIVKLQLDCNFEEKKVDSPVNLCPNTSATVSAEHII